MVEIGLTDANTTLRKPSGAPKTSQRQPQNAPKAIFGSKKRANEAQESSKTNLEALFGRSRGPKELPRAPQEPPKSSQKEPERAPKRFQNHLWVESVDFSRVELLPRRNQGCLRVGGSAWELKIDPKRLRKKEKNDIEKITKKRDENKRINSEKNSSKKL